MVGEEAMVGVAVTGALMVGVAVTGAAQTARGQARRFRCLEKDSREG